MSDLETLNLINFTVNVLENRLIGKTVPFLNKFLTYQEIADIFSQATGRSYSKQRIFQLQKKYSKGGEKND